MTARQTGVWVLAAAAGLGMPACDDGDATDSGATDSGATDSGATDSVDTGSGGAPMPSSGASSTAAADDDASDGADTAGDGLPGTFSVTYSDSAVTRADGSAYTFTFDADTCDEPRRSEAAGQLLGFNLRCSLTVNEAPAGDVYLAAVTLIFAELPTSGVLDAAAMLGDAQLFGPVTVEVRITDQTAVPAINSHFSAPYGPFKMADPTEVGDVTGASTITISAATDDGSTAQIAGDVDVDASSKDGTRSFVVTGSFDAVYTSLGR